MRFKLSSNDSLLHLASSGTPPRDSTHVFARDVPHVAHIHDATLMPDDANGDGVLAHLRGHVAIHLDAQLLQHQQACAGAGQRSEVNATQHRDVGEMEIWKWKWSCWTIRLGRIYEKQFKKEEEEETVLLLLAGMMDSNRLLEHLFDDNFLESKLCFHNFTANKKKLAPLSFHTHIYCDARNARMDIVLIQLLTFIVPAAFGIKGQLFAVYRRFSLVHIFTTSK